MKVTNITNRIMSVNAHGNNRLVLEPNKEVVLTFAEQKMYGVSLHNLHKAKQVIFGSADNKVEDKKEEKVVAPVAVSNDPVVNNGQTSAVTDSTENNDSTDAITTPVAVAGLFERSTLEAMSEEDLKELCKTHSIALRGKKLENLIEALLELK